MIGFNKTVQTAVAIVSCLAEHFDEGQTKLSSRRIAQERDRSQPLVAKLLSQLSHKGLVQSTPGPNGGYWLSKPPEDITLYDVASCFSNPEELPMCPFGPNWCGVQDPCPLHQTFIDMNTRIVEFLHETHFGRFRKPSDS